MCRGSGGVDTYTGQMVVTSSASINVRGFGVPFSTQLAYDSSFDWDGVRGRYVDVGFGLGWRPVGLAGLVGSGGKMKYLPKPGNAEVFTPESGGSYKASYFIESKLESVGGGHKLIKPSGRSMTFDSSGNLTGIVSAGGTEATVTRDTNAWHVKVEDSGGDEWECHYGLSGGKVVSMIYKVNGHSVLKTVYGYDGDYLVTVKTYENSAESGEDWGTTPIEAARYSYADSTLKHVVPPVEYRQMVNNGINPDTASDAELSDYAETEYVCSGAYYDQKITRMYTHGRRYQLDFDYSTSLHTGNLYNVWRNKTEVTRPGEVVETFYFNGVGEVMVRRMEQKSGSTVLKTWYPVYQEFESDGGARIVRSAGDSAIESFSETEAGLVTLVTTGAEITDYSYNSDGLLEYVAVRNGTGGSANKVREYTYVSGHGNVRPVASETVYRNEGNTGAITTGYAYLWHGSTNQISRRTTTLPAVVYDENGRNLAVTRVENYDARGYLTSKVDERGTETSFGYDEVKGGMTEMVEDVGGEDLTTNYELDARGRTILEEGPVHKININGTSEDIRSAQWTYYKDREGQRWTFRGYRTTAGTPASQIVGPVTVVEPNLAPPSGMSSYDGWRQSSVYDAVYSGSGIPSETTTFARASWVRWRIGLFDESSEKKEEWTYFDIPSGGYGSQSTNYGKRLFAYDAAGRLNQTTCAGGTVDKTTFNAMGWAEQEELGTSAGLAVVRENDYDDDGNLTEVTLPVDSVSGNDRVTEYRYDWRNRRTETETVVEKDGGGTWTLIEKADYDNLDRIVSTTGYHTSVVNANRTSYRTTDYDVLGRPYRTRVYAVSGSGTPSDPQVSNVYYEAGNQVARNAPSGSELFTANTYDALGRMRKSFQAYEPSGYGEGTDPASVTSAVVMEQQEMEWDEAGNLVSTTSRKRFDTATGNGELKTPSTQPKALVSYTANYADAIGRSLATAEYGTNDGDAWSRSPTVPARSGISPQPEVTSHTYSPAGMPAETTDPAGVDTCRTWDDADRLVKLVENCHGGGGSSGSSSSGSGSGGGDIRTIHYGYTDDGWLREQRCENPSTGIQVTTWTYGVTPALGSALYSNRLVRRKTYPDGGGDHVEYTYNRQLQLTGLTDQLGTVHAYGYDKLGRLLTDEVTTFGSGVDDAVNKLESAYDERGRKARATSYLEVNGYKANEIEWEYNGFNQPVAELQEHWGGVDSGSLKVGYDYEDGSDNTIRPTGITYPHVGAGSPTTIDIDYASAMADALSRVDRIKEGGTVLSSWKYVGLGMVAAQKYDAAANTELTYGSAGDSYSGYDRFGRIIATLWKKDATEQVKSSYGRNAFGGISWRRDMKAHDDSVTTQDDFYWYDGLRQVYEHDRGDLTPSSPPYTGINPSTRQQQEILSYDEMGNWLTDYSQSPSLIQSRTHTKANEIAVISGPSGVTQPGYDAAGNMTTMPQPGDWTEAYDCKWDAWNRLVEIKDGSTVVGAYTYDALTRRTRKDAFGEERDYYYDLNWRVVQERVNGTVKAENLYSPFDRWNLIRRKHSYQGTLDETQYVLRDGLDPVAIIETDGTVTERYRYDAFGPVGIMNPDFSDRSGSSVGWNWLFHGEFIDEESGLYNYGYRYYDPVTGRWPSRDPIGERGGVNLYGFVGNDGVNWWDVLGMQGFAGLAGNPPRTERVPDMGDHLRGAHEPYDDLGEQDWWEKNQSKVVQKYKDFARIEISSQVDCDTKPTQVKGYVTSHDFGGVLLGSVSFRTESRVQITWDGEDWSWSATLTISDELGTDFDSPAETLLALLGGGIITPPVPVIRASFTIKDKGCCDD